MIMINDINVTTLPTRKTAMSPLPLRSMKPMTSRDSPSVLAADKSRRCVPTRSVKGTLVCLSCDQLFKPPHSLGYLVGCPDCPI